MNVGSYMQQRIGLGTIPALQLTNLKATQSLSWLVLRLISLKQSEHIFPINGCVGKFIPQFNSCICQYDICIMIMKYNLTSSPISLCSSG